VVTVTDAPNPFATPGPDDVPPTAQVPGAQVPGAPMPGAQLPPGDPPPMPSYETVPGPPPVSYGWTPPAQQPMTPDDERLWAMLAHLSILAFSIIAPIIILAVYGKRSQFVSDQAKEALNFHITLFLAGIVSAILIFVIIGIFLLMAVAIGGLVFGIIAAIKAYEGTPYRYPVNIRFLS
jgi:uncharacterized protein